MPHKSPAASPAPTPSPVDPAALDKVRQILGQRGKTHGNWTIQSLVAQAIKDVFHAMPNWGKLTPMMREGLDNLAQKVSRIGCGNPDEPDHWRDSAGYMTLVADAIEKALAMIAEEEAKKNGEAERSTEGSEVVREDTSVRRQRNRQDRRTRKSG